MGAANGQRIAGHALQAGPDDQRRVTPSSLGHSADDAFEGAGGGRTYEIAHDYLARSGIVRDQYETLVFLAQVITAMVDQGQSNRIRMANRAIAAYEQSRLCRDVVAGPHGHAEASSHAIPQRR